jgi:ribosomal protein L7/L12
MFPTKVNNVNSFDLVQAVDFLVTTKQWNDVTRFQACETPAEFIAMVDKFREDPNTVNKLLKVESCELWIVGTGPNKINAIKAFRELFGAGLADSKYAIEHLPFRTCAFKMNEERLLYAIEILEDGDNEIALRPIMDKPYCEFASTCRSAPANWMPKRRHTLEIRNF